MFIYKITNTLNNKVYIGQSINSIQDRWHRHCTDAENNILDTHLARAIRKYGKEAFTIEVIDTATTQEELTQKESAWIRFYDAVATGYNETDAEYKCGGNTYQSKTPNEMILIRSKLSESKKGGKNPNAAGVKCKNIETNEEYHFTSQAEMQTFFGETNHQFISRRCRHEVKCLYKNLWLIAYENEDYITDYTKKGETKRKGFLVKVTNNSTGEVEILPSIRATAEKYPIVPRQRLMLILKGEHKQIPEYQFELIK